MAWNGVGRVVEVIALRLRLQQLLPDTALVIMETHLEVPDPSGALTHVTRRATYVFGRNAEGQWRCTVDNSYGTDLLGER